MFTKPFKFSGNNPTDIDSFLQSTFGESWNYLDALGLRETDLEQVPFEQIVNNPTDLIDGVIKVELKLRTRFFDMFDNLIIEHRSDDSTSLMFYSEVHKAEPILAFFDLIKASLGGGFIKESKFSSFNQTAKVRRLATGQFDNETDELIHTWLNGNITVTLNYKLSPLRQLLFLVGIKAENQLDLTPRNKGTVLQLFKHDIRDIVKSKEIKAEIIYAEDKIKFVDYTFDLNPPELGIFEEVRVRIFDKDKRIEEQIQTHVTYYSKYEIDTAATIRLCDQIAKIYGRDNYGDSEMKPHELDLIDDIDFWPGRSWLFNMSHGLQDLADPEQSTLYGVTITANPDEDGLSLHILVFNKMLDYHNLMPPNSLS